MSHILSKKVSEKEMQEFLAAKEKADRYKAAFKDAKRVADELCPHLDVNDRYIEHCDGSKEREVCCRFCGKGL